MEVPVTGVTSSLLAKSIRPVEIEGVVPTKNSNGGTGRDNKEEGVGKNASANRASRNATPQ